jgi:hypothetical protein
MPRVVLPAWSAAKQQSQVFGEIWRKLSVRQRPQPGSIELLHINRGRVTELEEPIGSKIEAIEQEQLSSLSSKKPQLVRLAAGGYVKAIYEDYTLPSLDLLAEPEIGFAAVQE